MKHYKVTVLCNGRMETFDYYHTGSVSQVKKSLTNYWNSELIFDVKIIKVEKVENDKAISK